MNSQKCSPVDVSARNAHSGPGVTAFLATDIKFSVQGKTMRRLLGQEKRFIHPWSSVSAIQPRAQSLPVKSVGPHFIPHYVTLGWRLLVVSSRLLNRE